MNRMNELYRRYCAMEIVNETASEMVWRGFDYLDVLCSNSFEDLSLCDKDQLRKTLAHVADMCNWFLGNCLCEEDRSIGEKAMARNNCMERIENITPSIRVFFPYEPLPECIAVADSNVRTLVKKAHELVLYLISTKPSVVYDDWEIVFEILHNIILSTRKPYADLSAEYIIT